MSWAKVLKEKTASGELSVEGAAVITLQKMGEHKTEQVDYSDKSFQGEFDQLTYAIELHRSETRMEMAEFWRLRKTKLGQPCGQKST